MELLAYHLRELVVFTRLPLAGSWHGASLLDENPTLHSHAPATLLAAIEDQATVMGSTRLPFIDLGAQQRALGDGLQRAIKRVLNHGEYILGPEVDELEDALSTYVGVRHVVTCSSGTDALLMALTAQGIGPDDAVFTTPFTFIATAEVIGRLGARPVFVDVDANTFNIDPDALERAIDAVKREGRYRPALVITVDLFGLPCDYARIQPIVARHGLCLVEDAAQAFGARWNGRAAGTLGHAGTTSFFPSKPLGAYGDGGAVFTDNAALADLVRSLRSHGSGSSEYDNVSFGLNARLDTLQAAVLLEKLKLFPRECEQRQVVAQRYSDALGECVDTPRVPAGMQSAWAHYSIKTPLRDAVRDTLTAAGIPSAVYYRTPLHLQPVFAHLNYQPGDMPVAESCAAEILSLPMHPYLNLSDQARIICTVKRALAAAGGAPVRAAP